MGTARIQQEILHPEAWAHTASPVSVNTRKIMAFCFYSGNNICLCKIGQLFINLAPMKCS